MRGCMRTVFETQQSRIVQPLPIFWLDRDIPAILSCYWIQFNRIHLILLLLSSSTKRPKERYQRHQAFLNISRKNFHKDQMFQFGIKYFGLDYYVEVRKLKSASWGYVHTKPDKFENATFFIRIGLPSTLKRRFRCPKTEVFENALQSG